MNAKNKNTIMRILDIFFKQITQLGGLVFFGIIIAFSYLAGSSQLSFTLLISIITMTLAGAFIKLMFFKERPKKIGYKNIIEKIDAGSFPSLHTMRIFSLAVILGTRYGSGNLLLIVFLALIAAIVSYSRIYLKKHYLKDVFWGALFSLIINISLIYFI
ncbi:MAG: phosphatase PAP2 family protein [Candidatus Woesearchaeota archaeon]